MDCAYLVREMRERNAKPNFRLLWAMMFYLDEFPEKMHRPRRMPTLFAKLPPAYYEADAVVAELERQHTAGATQIADLELVTRALRRRKPEGLDRFSAAVRSLARRR